MQASSGLSVVGYLKSLHSILCRKSFMTEDFDHSEKSTGFGLFDYVIQLSAKTWFFTMQGASLHLS